MILDWEFVLPQSKQFKAPIAAVQDDRGEFWGTSEYIQVSDEMISEMFFFKKSNLNI